MKELLKNQYKNVILVCCYIVVTTLVYTVSADCIWSIWWLDVIVGLLIAALGCYVGYRYIKSEEQIRLKKLEENNKVQEIVSEPSEDKIEENNSNETNEE